MATKKTTKVSAKQLALPAIPVSRILPKTSFLNTTPTPKVRAASPAPPAPPVRNLGYVPNKNESKMLEKTASNICSRVVDDSCNDFSTLHKMKNTGLPMFLFRVMTDYSISFHGKYGSFPEFSCSDLIILAESVSPLEKNTEKQVRKAINRLYALGHVTGNYGAGKNVGINRDSLRRLVATRSGI